MYSGVSKINELRYIFELFERCRLNYVLIRPLPQQPENGLKDIDMILCAHEYRAFLLYLEDVALNFKLHEVYANNKVLLEIENVSVLLDINIDKNCFTKHKIITLCHDMDNYDIVFCHGFSYKLLSEPYLFINWTLHQVLDKKSFRGGSVFEEYIDRYNDKYKEYLRTPEVAVVFTQLFPKHHEDVLYRLKCSLFLDYYVLDYNTIRYINSKVFNKKQLAMRFYYELKYGLRKLLVLFDKKISYFIR